MILMILALMTISAGTSTVSAGQTYDEFMVLYVAHDSHRDLVTVNGVEKATDAASPGVDELRAQGYNVTIWTIYDKDNDNYLDDPNNDWVAGPYGNGPPLETLEEYDLVIYDTGYDSSIWTDSEGLTHEDIMTLTEYLDRGGNLWLIGGDVLYDIPAGINEDGFDPYTGDMYNIPPGTGFADDYPVIMNLDDWYLASELDGVNSNSYHYGMQFLYLYLGVNQYVMNSGSVSDYTVDDVAGITGHPLGDTLGNYSTTSSEFVIGGSERMDLLVPHDIDDVVMGAWLSDVGVTGVMVNYSDEGNEGQVFQTAFSSFSLADIESDADRTEMMVQTVKWFEQFERPSFTKDVAMTAVLPIKKTHVWSEEANGALLPYGDIYGVVGEKTTVLLQMRNFGTTAVTDAQVNFTVIDMETFDVVFFDITPIASIDVGNFFWVFQDFTPHYSGRFMMAAEVWWDQDENHANDFWMYVDEEPLYHGQDYIKCVPFYEDFEIMNDTELLRWRSSGDWTLVDVSNVDPAPANHSDDMALYAGDVSTVTYGPGEHELYLPLIDLSHFEGDFDTVITFRLTGSLEVGDSMILQLYNKTGDVWYDLWGGVYEDGVDITYKWARPIYPITGTGTVLDGENYVGVPLFPYIDLFNHMTQFRFVITNNGDVPHDGGIFVDDFTVTGLESIRDIGFKKYLDVYEGTPGEDLLIHFEAIDIFGMGFTMDAEVPEGWTYEIVEVTDRGYMDDMGHYELTLSIPEGAEGGANDVTIIAESELDVCKLGFYINIEGLRSFEVELVNDSVPIIAGSGNATVDFTITNTGNMEHSFFQFVYGTPGWWNDSIRMSDGSPEDAMFLAPGETRYFTAHVKVPSNGTSQDQVNISIISLNNFEMKELNFSIDVRVLAMEVSGQSELGEMLPDVTTTTTFTVSNTGTWNDTYSLEVVNDAGVTVVMKEGVDVVNSVWVEYGTSKDITLEVTIDEVSGVSVGFSVVATSDTNDTFSDSVNYTGTILAYGIELGEPAVTHKDADPGMHLTFTFDANNTGEVEDDIMVTLTGVPAGWDAVIDVAMTGTITGSDGTWNLTGVDGGTSIPLVLDITVSPTAGEVTGTLVVTLTSGSDDSFSDDATFTVTVLPPGEVDLLFSNEDGGDGITLVLSGQELTTLQVGTRYNLEGHVQNAGPGVLTEDFEVAVYLDDVVAGSEILTLNYRDGLDAEEFKVRYKYWQPAVAGTFTVFMVIDPLDDIEESNENNNEVSIQVIVEEAAGGTDDDSDRGTPGFEVLGVLVSMAVIMFRRR